MVGIDKFQYVVSFQVINLKTPCVMLQILLQVWDRSSFSKPNVWMKKHQFISWCGEYKNILTEQFCDFNYESNTDLDGCVPKKALIILKQKKRDNQLPLIWQKIF